jgi:hypothetical protein
MGLAVQKGIGLALKGADWVQNLYPDASKAIERQRTLFTASQSISGNTAQIDRLSKEALNAMGPRMGREGDDMRVIAGMQNVVPTKYTSNMAEMAGFNFSAHGTDAATTTAGYAGLLSGKTTNSMYKIGMLTTNPDGSQKDPTQIAKELYQKFNLKNAKFTSLEDLNASITAGVIYSNLNALNLTPESRDAIETYFRDQWQADHMGKEFSTKAGSEYSKARGLDDKNASPYAIEGPTYQGTTGATESSREGQVQSYEMSMKVQEGFYDGLANITDKMGPFGDAVIAATGALGNIWNFVKDKLGGGGGTGGAGTGGAGLGGTTAGLGGSPTSPSSKFSATATSQRGTGGLGGASVTPLKGSSAGLPSFSAAAGTVPFSSSTPTGSATGGLPASVAGATDTSTGTTDVPSKAKDSDPDAVAKYLAGQLASLGLTTAQIAGVLGNIQQESGFNPKSVQEGGPGRGLAQWSVTERWAELKKWAKKNGDLDPWSAETQVAYILKEMKDGWGNFDLKEYKKIKTAMAAGHYFGSNYEVFGVSGSRDSYVEDWERKLGKKKSYASGAWDVQGDQTARVHNGEMIVPAQFAAELRKAFDGGGKGGGGTINVTVNLSDASQRQATQFVGWVADEFRKMNKLDALAGS